MNVKLNKTILRNKIHGCWIGKNIGGTMGAPFEGKRDMNDINGFSSPKGEPLPNDDLDLQLVWLKAMEQVGPYSLSANILGEYWLTHISPHWNEYGIGKGNMEQGILPTLSGELFNDDWKHSNGAWIRSEIWACLAPGFPNIAIKYAIMDACIDHGISEGTYAEVFTAALESIAFIESDIRTVIEQALTFIPDDSRVAKCVRLVLSEYDKKTPYSEVRELLVKETSDLGWFQAPANVGFTIIGLIYGEGDFKKSLIYAINCGDDTDCTAATCGAILGIIYGADRIPNELKDYIGDKIVTICINACYREQIPSSCFELTEKVIKMIPTVLNAHNIYMEYTEGEVEYDKKESFNVLNKYAFDYFKRNSRSFEISNGHFLRAVVEYEKDPVISAGDNFKVKIIFHHLYEQTLITNIQLNLPEGWNAEYRKSVFIYYNNQKPRSGHPYELVINVGEDVRARNNITIAVTTLLNPLPLYIPITLLG